METAELPTVSHICQFTISETENTLTVARRERTSYLGARNTDNGAAIVLARGVRLQKAPASAPLPRMHLLQVAERFLACITAPALLVLPVHVPAHL